MKALVDQTMSARKTSVQNKVWACLDPNNTGSTTGHKIVEVLSLKESIDNVLDSWPQTKGGNLDGVISRDEYWSRVLELAQMLPNDDRYVRVICMYWGVCENVDGHVDQKEAYRVIALMR